MSKSKKYWKPISDEERWKTIPKDEVDYINKKYHLEESDWDNPASNSVDYYNRDKIRLSEFGRKSDVITLSTDNEMSDSKATDNVNNPPHYQQGSQEVIDIIEGAIIHAPEPITGMLQAQVLKYLLRMWHKADPSEDAKKAQWYLNRLVEKL